jgi:hypothetical protein
VLKVTVNKNASVQLIAASHYFDTFPNRIQAAQASAITAVATEAPQQLLKFGRAAKHFEFITQKYGSVGIKLTMKPTTRSASGPDGYNAAIGAAILLNGRRGGTRIRPKSGDALKFRDGTYRGSNRFFKEAKVSSIRSKRAEISRVMKDLVQREISNHLKYVGFGKRGAVPTGPDFLNAKEF